MRPEKFLKYIFEDLLEASKSNEERKICRTCHLIH